MRKVSRKPPLENPPLPLIDIQDSFEGATGGTHRDRHVADHGSPRTGTCCPTDGRTDGRTPGRCTRRPGHMSEPFRRFVHSRTQRGLVHPRDIEQVTRCRRPAQPVASVVSVVVPHPLLFLLFLLLLLSRRLLPPLASGTRSLLLPFANARQRARTITLSFPRPIPLRRLSSGQDLTRRPRREGVKSIRRASAPSTRPRARDVSALQPRRIELPLA